MFPSVDGGEVVSRWDMQAYPPDVLITNVSMLSAMLTREVDEPIFSKTREWLEKPDSYFYLILDELHLQRGSAGTEVTYLLRLLLDRLGLTREEHRHKLRILASSASLPAEPEEEARASTDYLWDMFGLFGLPASTTSEEEGKARWRDSIVPGEEVRSARESAGHGTLDSRPYRELLDFALGRGRQMTGFVTKPLRPRIRPETTRSSDCGGPSRETWASTIPRTRGTSSRAAWRRHPPASWRRVGTRKKSALAPRRCDASGGSSSKTCAGSAAHPPTSPSTRRSRRCGRCSSCAGPATGCMVSCEETPRTRDRSECTRSSAA